MTSIERRKLRYQRRKMRRDEINQKRASLYTNIDSIFTFSKVMDYADKCCKGVGFKKSTQNFKLHEFTIIATTCRKIKTRTYKVGETYKFRINERGKVRDINAPHIHDRLVHKVLANEVILPLYSPHIIYDNGASMKDKGFSFALSRLKEKLYHWYLKNGYTGYVVTIDFSKYFENCSHEIIHDIHKKYVQNEQMIKIIEDYLFIGPGIALGVEIAQREACIIPNVCDHLLQNQSCQVIRYMDDTFFLVKTKEDADKILEDYFKLSSLLHIKVNQKKTKVISISNYFKFCKWHFHISNTGCIIMVPDKDTIYRQRRKLRRMLKMNIKKEEIKVTLDSFIAYLNMGNSNQYMQYLKYLYSSLSENEL